MRVRDRIDARLRQFLLAQLVFFVSAAPTALDEHVNASPARGQLHGPRRPSRRRAAYLDRTASGAEPNAHLRDNSRIAPVTELPA